MQQPLLFALIFCVACGSCLDLEHHRRAARQVRPEDVVMISEETMKKMSPQRLHYVNLQYTKEFFKPLDKGVPSTLTFVLDKRSFLREPPYAELIKDLENVQEVDFDARVRQQKDIYFPLYLHELESEQKSKTFGQEEEYLKVNMQKMQVMLNNVFTLPRNYRSEKSLRNAASEYISQKLGNLGLLVGVQYFYPSRFYNQFVGFNYKDPNPLETLPTGGNVFGILPGELWGTSRDRVVIIGAHWDTIDSTDGYNDNGSGVAAVLEIARQIVESKCRPKNTIIFATFDLEEMGGQGSNEFVVRYLIPEILRKYGQSDIEGALIADTIMNLNRTKNSQMMPQAWAAVDRVTAKTVAENDFRGDFLAVVQRRQPDQKLAKTFTKYWFHQGNQDEKYKLRKFRIDIGKEVPTIDELTDIVAFVRSDHSRFWTANETDFASMPAILLTDTGPLRGQMVECYHQACDSARSPYLGNFADMDFYQHVVQSLLYTVVELSKSQCLRSEDLTNFYEETNDMTASSAGSFMGGSRLSLTEFVRRFLPWKMM